MIRSAWELVRHPIRAIDSRRLGVDFVGLRMTTLVLGLLLIPTFYGAEMVRNALEHSDGHGRPFLTTILLMVGGLVLAVAGVYSIALAIVLIVKQVTATPQQGEHSRERPPHD